MQEMELIKKMAVVHMGEVQKPDTLVQVADFFLKLAEATWSIASGVCDHRLVVIFRNAGKMARDLFGKLGSAGGHKHSARTAVPLEKIDCEPGSGNGCRQYVLKQILKVSNVAD